MANKASAAKSGCHPRAWEALFTPEERARAEVLPTPPFGIFTLVHLPLEG
jgi:hypothetical protein